MPDGAMLRLTTAGSGHPLVLCHGGPGLWDYLDPLAGLLDDMSLVHRYDQRGCGESTGDGPFTVAQFVADLEMLREALGHATWWVGGHSWGAELALRYALAYPGRDRGVIYVCGTGIGDNSARHIESRCAAAWRVTLRAGSTCGISGTAPTLRSVSSACCNGDLTILQALRQRG